jgi:hypothetical protein
VHSNGRIYWLWCCFTVFLAGCGQTFVGTITPTQPLRVFSTPTFNPTAILRLIRTPTLRSSGTALAVIATPISLTIDPPVCYETPVGSVWCFGLVHNTSNMVLEQVTIRVYLVTVEGQALAERDTNPALAILSVNSRSPYGVLFDRMPERAAGPVAVLVNAVPLTPEKQTRLAKVAVSDLAYDNNDGVYSVNALLTNADQQALRDIDIIVTLLDEQDHVTGFRKQRLTHALQSGQSVPFKLDAIPQGRSTQSVEVAAEGWR